ncbi:MAG: protein-glutamate O-methyltransferase CheR [bacterium]|jgi:chemotaxis protein methyltransferase CheR|nr:protein-glutamate O-methyltransferase CheR [candidate division KSB1 bacterium]MDH7559302.1 protein-glutamate O-methyltransferase CheR [bacterium]
MDEVLALRDYLYERTGLYLPNSRRYMFEGRFLARMEAVGLANLGQYLAYLRKEEKSNGELTCLLNELAVGALSFFADPVRFRALGEVFIPDLVRRDKDRSKELVVWCLGCGTGQETYAAAMVMHQLQQTSLQGWNCLAWGTDRSVSAIAAAREGVYAEFALRGVPRSLLEQYLVPGQGQVRVSQHLKSMVRFDQFDVARLPTAVPENKVDIIFSCCELAHFDRQERGKMVEALHRTLRDGGYLVLGNLESLHGLRDGFRLVHFPGGFAYRKLLNSG